MRPMLLLVTALLLVMAPSTSAQFGGFGRGLDRPELDSAELARIADRLELDEAEVELAEQLHAAYVARVGELGRQAQRVMEGARSEFRRTRDRSVWRDLREVMAGFEDQRDRLTETLMEDLQLALGVGDEAWSGVERQHRRLSDLPDRAVLSGEAVDLVLLAEDLGVAGDESVAGVLATYELELDRAIRARDAAQAPIREDPFAYFGPDAGEAERAALEEAREASAAIKSVHERFARRIRPLLPPEVAERFDRELRERSFPRVYAETAADRALAMADELASLSADQREAIDGVAERYRRDVSAANQRLARAIEEDELTRLPGPPRRQGAERNEELTRLNEEKRRLVAETVGALRSILTDEQAEALPEPEEADWRRRARRAIEGSAP